MLMLTLILSALLCTWGAGALRHCPCRANVVRAACCFAAVWLAAVCIYNTPGLTVDFSAFRAGAILAMAGCINVCVYGFRCAKNKLPVLMLCALGMEVFLFNAPFFASHDYQPIDLTSCWDDSSTAVLNGDGSVTLADGYDTLVFSGFGEQPLYNLQLDGLEYTGGAPYTDAQNPLFTFVISVTDEGAGRSRQGWTWDVAWKAPRSFSRTLDLTVPPRTLTLQAAAYRGEYTWYSLEYTLQGIRANVPRAFAFSLGRFFVVFAGLAALWALRPSGAAWRKSFSGNEHHGRSAAVLCGVVLAVLAAAAPFADPNASGVATRHYNVNNWDECSRVSFTAHINDWQRDAPDSQYGSLAHSLLNGRLDLMVDPPESLNAMDNPFDTALRAEQAPDALWDVGYYQGRYYVYFGVVPCLLFQLPFEALTGIQDLPNAVGMVAAALLYLAAVFGAVHQAARRWFPQASAAMVLLCSVGCTACSPLYYLLMRSAVYEYAILCGAAFVMTALWQWLCASNTDPAHRGRLMLHLALGSLCMALVAGCRPQMEVFSFLVVPIFWERYVKQKRLFTREGLAELAVFLIPVMLVAAGLMWYNAARFGSVFDFGANYNLTSNDMTRRGFKLGRIAPALFTGLLSLPVVRAVFPYLDGAKMATNFAGVTITEVFYGGVFACIPMLWSFAVLPALKTRARQKPGLTGVVCWTLAASVMLVIVDCEMAGVLYRYLSDFLPVMLFAAALCWLLAEQALQNRTDAFCRLQKPLRVAAVCTAAVGIVYNFCVFFAAEPYLYGQNPGLYQTMSRLVQFWM